MAAAEELSQRSELDLRRAKVVYCKTRKAQKYLKTLGFQSVILYRAKRYEVPRPFIELY
jgi:hypothetical protein